MKKVETYSIGWGFGRYEMIERAKIANGNMVWSTHLKIIDGFKLNDFIPRFIILDTRILIPPTRSLKFQPGKGKSLERV